jgi:DNA-binding XRE family transcriptional regulator
MRPFLEYFRGADMTHFDHTPNFKRDDERGVKVFPSSSFDSRTGKLGFEIRTRRLEKGWTQQRLARAAGLCHSHLSEIERGHCNPHHHTLRVIEDALQISLGNWASHSAESAKPEKPKIAEGVALIYPPPYAAPDASDY